jgi:hypothetical protein
MRFVGFGSLDRFSAGISQLVGGWRAEAWPRGVQEEDPERPWGRFAAAQADSEPLEDVLPAPSLTPVRASVRPR